MKAEIVNLEGKCAYLFNENMTKAEKTTALYDALYEINSSAHDRSMQTLCDKGVETPGVHRWKQNKENRYSIMELIGYYAN
ncbi:MAG: hypothetical protein MJ246_02415 [Clostridia bacterium]|nr:hypothetical protein [Clostridia bacterium]